MGWGVGVGGTCAQERQRRRQHPARTQMAQDPAVVCDACACLRASVSPLRYTFKSWREFPHPDEEDVEAAESREHRRWIER